MCIETENICAKTADKTMPHTPRTSLPLFQIWAKTGVSGHRPHPIYILQSHHSSADITSAVLAFCISYKIVCVLLLLVCLCLRFDNQLFLVLHEYDWVVWSELQCFSKCRKRSEILQICSCRLPLIYSFILKVDRHPFWIQNHGKFISVTFIKLMDAWLQVKVVWF